MKGPLIGRIEEKLELLELAYRNTANAYRKLSLMPSGLWREAGNRSTLVRAMVDGKMKEAAGADRFLYDSPTSLSEYLTVQTEWERQLTAAHKEVSTFLLQTKKGK
ncbi:hypothetical protein HY045_03175 [Candidatus Woesebacteria bacterium]|nr:hypothetical protein [Candidatus Woesebacteria bacterium]